VLVVEDDPASRGALRQGLADRGAAVIEAADGVEAIHLAAEQRPELVVLDLMLPLLDGEHVIAHLRRVSDPPIIVVSAKRSEEARVHALDLGADDYLVKPFTLTELTARIRAVLRRSGAQRTPELETPALDFQLDPAAMAVTRGGERLPLTTQEFALLDLLVRQRGRIVSREAIEATILTQGRSDASNVVDVVVMRLRKKLGRELITTRRGQGFIIEG
jgi:two-component system, OmpR family, response regulator